ncbi:uncharacterized protein MYCFIDRAFT_177558 [Pseudocercospora fijiensis CIRAD86]|uniref:Uncharacterized protein n=1 Tax=Pseudocercospora fijiensis (strain CIRAD86) TaxID=383855 RepID=M3AU00_PSEFD|nr:uncharacterized protein MYCFIDRAFT_177558 [Pseudocercospora fijiensis CIRAD86]EME80628.1 hypothetical protein MYCFIDRAFT_177558 [Pseudocercospora fijiensis CIRAD86]
MSSFDERPLFRQRAIATAFPSTAPGSRSRPHSCSPGCLTSRRTPCLHAPCTRVSPHAQSSNPLIQGRQGKPHPPPAPVPTAQASITFEVAPSNQPFMHDEVRPLLGRDEVRQMQVGRSTRTILDPDAVAKKRASRRVSLLWPPAYTSPHCEPPTQPTDEPTHPQGRATAPTQPTDEPTHPQGRATTPTQPTADMDTSMVLQLRRRRNSRSQASFPRALVLRSDTGCGRIRRNVADWRRTSRRQSQHLANTKSWSLSSPSQTTTSVATVADDQSPCRLPSQFKTYQVWRLDFLTNLQKPPRAAIYESALLAPTNKQRLTPIPRMRRTWTNTAQDTSIGYCSCDQNRPAIALHPGIILISDERRLPDQITNADADKAQHKSLKQVPEIDLPLNTMGDGTQASKQGRYCKDQSNTLTCLSSQYMLPFAFIVPSHVHPKLVDPSYASDSDTNFCAYRLSVESFRPPAPFTDSRGPPGHSSQDAPALVNHYPIDTSYACWEIYNCICGNVNTAGNMPSFLPLIHRCLPRLAGSSTLICNCIRLDVNNAWSTYFPSLAGFLFLLFPLITTLLSHHPSLHSAYIRRHHSIYFKKILVDLPSLRGRYHQPKTQRLLPFTIFIGSSILRHLSTSFLAISIGSLLQHSSRTPSQDIFHQHPPPTSSTNILHQHPPPTSSGQPDSPSSLHIFPSSLPPRIQSDAGADIFSSASPGRHCCSSSITNNFSTNILAVALSSHPFFRQHPYQQDPTAPFAPFFLRNSFQKKQAYPYATFPIFLLPHNIMSHMRTISSVQTIAFAADISTQHLYPSLLTVIFAPLPPSTPSKLTDTLQHIPISSVQMIAFAADISTQHLYPSLLTHSHLGILTTFLCLHDTTILDSRWIPERKKERKVAAARSQKGFMKFPGKAGSRQPWISCKAPSERSKTSVRPWMKINTRLPINDIHKHSAGWFGVWAVPVWVTTGEIPRAVCMEYGAIVDVQARRLVGFGSLGELEGRQDSSTGCRFRDAPLDRGYVLRRGESTSTIHSPQGLFGVWHCSFPLLSTAPAFTLVVEQYSHDRWEGSQLVLAAPARARTVTEACSVRKATSSVESKFWDALLDTESGRASRVQIYHYSTQDLFGIALFLSSPPHRSLFHLFLPISRSDLASRLDLCVVNAGQGASSGLFGADSTQVGREGVGSDAHGQQVEMCAGELLRTTVECMTVTSRSAMLDALSATIVAKAAGDEWQGSCNCVWSVELVVDHRLVRSCWSRFLYAALVRVKFAVNLPNELGGKAPLSFQELTRENIGTSMAYCSPLQGAKAHAKHSAGVRVQIQNAHQFQQNTYRTTKKIVYTKERRKCKTVRCNPKITPTSVAAPYLLNAPNQGLCHLSQCCCHCRGEALREFRETLRMDLGDWGLRSLPSEEFLDCYYERRFTSLCAYEAVYFRVPSFPEPFVRLLVLHQRCQHMELSILVKSTSTSNASITTLSKALSYFPCKLHKSVIDTLNFPVQCIRWIPPSAISQCTKVAHTDATYPHRAMQSIKMISEAVHDRVMLGAEVARRIMLDYFGQSPIQVSSVWNGETVVPRLLFLLFLEACRVSPVGAKRVRWDRESWARRGTPDVAIDLPNERLGSKCLTSCGKLFDANSRHKTRLISANGRVYHHGTRSQATYSQTQSFTFTFCQPSSFILQMEPGGWRPKAGEIKLAKAALARRDVGRRLWTRITQRGLVFMVKEFASPDSEVASLAICLLLLASARKNGITKAPVELRVRLIGTCDTRRPFSKGTDTITPRVLTVLVMRKRSQSRPRSHRVKTTALQRVTAVAGDSALFIKTWKWRAATIEKALYLPLLDPLPSFCTPFTISSFSLLLHAYSIHSALCAHPDLTRLTQGT